MNHQWTSLDIFSRTLFYNDDDSEVRFDLSSTLLEKVLVEKSENRMMGQLCGPIVADRHNMCPKLLVSKMRANQLYIIDKTNYLEINRLQPWLTVEKAPQNRLSWVTMS